MSLFEIEYCSAIICSNGLTIYQTSYLTFDYYHSHLPRTLNISLNFDLVVSLLGCVLKRCTKKSADVFENLTTNILPDIIM